MTETPEPKDLPAPPQIKKGCQISIMFPVENDKDAFGIKEAIDIIVNDIKDKRYTFQITEM